MEAVEERQRKGLGSTNKGTRYLGPEEGMEGRMDTVDLGAGDLERELMGRLTALAEENRSLSKPLEATQRLVEHRETVDELIGQALRDAVGLAELQVELQELKVRRESLRQIVDQDAEVLKKELKQMGSCLQDALGLLSRVEDLGRELETKLSSLADRLDHVELVHREDEQVPESRADLEDLSGVEGGEVAQAESAEEESPVGERRQETRDSLAATLEQEGEDVPKPRAETESTPAGEGSEEGLVDPIPVSPSVVGPEGETDTSMQQTPSDKVQTEGMSAWWFTRRR